MQNPSNGVKTWILNKLHKLTCFWKRAGLVGHPDLTHWFCILRRCKLCGQVQYHSFNTFGDNRWHAVEDPKGCMPWEHTKILQAVDNQNTKGWPILAQGNRIII